MISKKRNLIIILVWPIIASLLSFLFNAGFLFSTFLFLGIPSLYLSLINKKFIAKSVMFSLILSLPIAIIFDYVMELTGGWFLPYSLFDGFRLFDYVIVDQIFWLFLYIYFIVMFYECFLDKKCTPELYFPEIKYLVVVLLTIFTLFISTYLTNPASLQINYFYLKAGIIMGLMPIVIALTKYSVLYKKFFKTGAYFFFFSLIYELTALQLGQWSFPNKNQFIGIINVFGVSFPFEELFFWFVLGAMAVLSYYEVFDDDKK